MAQLSRYLDLDSANDTRHFLKFKESYSRNAYNNVGRTFYLGRNKLNETCIYVAGNNGLYSGIGTNRVSFYSFTPIGFVTPDELEPGEQPEEIHIQAGLDPGNVYVVTNYRNLFAMGANNSRVLGTGDDYAQYAFKKVIGSNQNIEKFRISQGYNQSHCFAITNDKKLYSWGYNADGQLGIPGNTTNQSTPTLVSDKGSLSGLPTGVTVEEVYPFQSCDGSGNGGSTFVIDTANGVHATGNNTDGQLGTGEKSNRSSFVQISANGAPVRFNKIYGCIYGSGGTVFALSGTKLFGTGDNSHYQLGHNIPAAGTSTFTINATVSSLPIQDIEFAGIEGRTVFALLTSGEVVGWGNSTNYIFGNGSNSDIGTPAAPSYYNFNSAPSNLAFGTEGGDKAIKIRLLGGASPTLYILTEQGKVYTTGNNADGRRGVGHNNNPDTGANSYLQRATAAQHPYNRRFLDITIWGVGDGTSGCTAVDEKGQLWSLGTGNSGQSGTLLSITGETNSNNLPATRDSHVWTKCVVRKDSYLGNSFGADA